MKLNILLITIVTLISHVGISQESIPITKDEALRRVFESNATLKISEKAYAISEAEYKQTNTTFLPNIKVSHTAMTATNPLMAFGSKLNQEILTPDDFNPQLLNDPSQIQNFATMIEVEQPLLNFDAFYQRKAAKAKMNAMALQNERTKEYMAFEVEDAYMKLQLAYKSVEVMQVALAAAQESQKIAKARYQQGLLQKSDLLTVQVRLSEVTNQLQSAKSTLDNASNYLSYLLNDDSYQNYLPIDSLSISKINLEVHKLPEGRSDIQSMRMILDAHKAANVSDKMAFLPRLNAFGSYQLFADRLFQANANGYVIGAQLSWDIFKGSERISKAQKSRSVFEKSKLEYERYISKSELELNKTKRMLHDAENRIYQANLALEQSKESFRIRTNRYKEGLEGTAELIAAEALYARKRLEYYQSIYDYNYAQAYLSFLTLEK